MAVKIKVHSAGLLDYIKAGKILVQRARKAMTVSLNAGRTHARQLIRSQFQVRTGVLRKQARSMRTEVKISAGEISGKVKPLPNLMNIFEYGATLARGRGHLRPRPVVGPGRIQMEVVAHREFTKLLSEVGK